MYTTTKPLIAGTEIGKIGNQWMPIGDRRIPAGTPVQRILESRKIGDRIFWLCQFGSGEDFAAALAPMDELVAN